MKPQELSHKKNEAYPEKFRYIKIAFFPYP